MTPTRIYAVHTADTVRLVRAANADVARNHVARETIIVQVASQDDLVAYLTALPPAVIEDAGRRRDAGAAVEPEAEDERKAA